MTPQQFIIKWKQANLTERSAAQQHFLDICELLQQQKPAEADPDGSHYTFERGAHKTDGGEGWADVWKKDHFGWEYKGRHRDLVAAYRQLLQYREALDNPPLLVVCDLDRAVLQRINANGNIFFAESDRDWILDGANVHVSMIGFDDGTEVRHTLDGQPVSRINPNLSTAADTTRVNRSSTTQESHASARPKKHRSTSLSRPL